MVRIFISYRRDDSAGYAGWLFTLLRNHFARDDIFMDIDSLDVGEDFVAVLEREVGSCDAVVALIGPRWLSAADAAGNRRLDDPRDFVRLELATALSRGVRVCPALVHGATMPNVDALPDDLKPLVRRNAIELNDARFPDDVRRLATALERALAESIPLAAPPSESPGRSPVPPREYAPTPPKARSAWQRWAGWSRLQKAAAVFGVAIAIYAVYAIVYLASGDGSHSNAPPRITPSGARRAAGGHPTGASAPTTTSIPINATMPCTDCPDTYGFTLRIEKAVLDPAHARVTLFILVKSTVNNTQNSNNFELLQLQDQQTGATFKGQGEGFSDFDLAAYDQLLVRPTFSFTPTSGHAYRLQAAILAGLQDVHFRSIAVRL